jgi:thiosulfate/3-mercaptopyruvate sulfurtransferase
MGCTSCHNGNNSTDDKTLAHSGDFISHPSLAYQDKCATCHSPITDGFTTNIHQGVGQKRKVCIRDGKNGPDDFELLDASLQRGYNNNCATCHGTCGTCHVNRPTVGGGGLMAGHNFQAPDWRNNCITCHTSRGGHAYLGVAPGTKPDIHYVYPPKSDTIHYDESFEGKTDLRYTCMNCHDTEELHGDGVEVDQRYAYSKLPTCEECHPTTIDGLTPLEDANTYHTKHYNDFNCHVCHSQDYNSCGSCHVNGEGARIPHYLDFKIAKNPIPDVKSGYPYALVRRTPGAPDNFDLYTGKDYENFDALPIFNYTTPHNIQKWTSRTNKNYLEEGKCGKYCHFKITGNDTLNKDLYLLKETLVNDWEVSSTEWMTMDDVLGL